MRLSEIFSIVTIVLSAFAIGSSVASAETIRVAITSSYAPYHFIDKQGSPAGIHYEVIKKIAEKNGHKVVFTIVPRKRLETMTVAGDEDAFVNAIEWTTGIDRFVYSDPVSVIEDVIFTRTSTPLKFNSFEDLTGKRLISIRGYHYPDLVPWVTSKKVSVIETHDELAALKMLDDNRGDGAIVVRSIGQWLIKNNKFNNSFEYSTKPVTHSEFRLIFNKKWKGFLIHFNQDLAVMKSDGSLDKILDKYLHKD